MLNISDDRLSRWIFPGILPENHDERYSRGRILGHKIDEYIDSGGFAATGITQ